MNNDELIDKVNQLEEIVDRLERRVFTLENPITMVFDKEELPNRCPTCNIDFSGTMGYVCTRTDCPMQPIVTCGSTGR